MRDWQDRSYSCLDSPCTGRPGPILVPNLVELTMSQLILRTMVATGILLGAATASFAAPVPLPLALNAASQAGNVQTVY